MSTSPATPPAAPKTAEHARLIADAARHANWKRWGPYLAERQWGTVREDYSANGDCWNYLSHDHARSRAYRWGEDGLLGFCDRQCRLCFALALWNERDPILKERLFGLTNNEGNHGEDVKECYYYLDSTPTHSYMKALYKYPQRAFPYEQLVAENRNRNAGQPEFELIDTGIFDDHRYFDVIIEYAKASPEDMLIRITVHNRGPEAARCHVLPTIWFRNTWSWGRTGEGYDTVKPTIEATGPNSMRAAHIALGEYEFTVCNSPNGTAPTLLFTENETNAKRLFNADNISPFVKDAFHDAVIHGRHEAVNPAKHGTKAAAHYVLEIPAGGHVTLMMRLRERGSITGPALGSSFDEQFTTRAAEADEFFNIKIKRDLSPEQYQVARQAFAGLLWTKQFYHYVVEQWLEGDPAQPPPPPERSRPGARNVDWSHLFNRDVISVCDKWEYPWYAAWDLAFHMIPFARLDPHFAKQQLLLFLREWYLHPNGQIPAYEFAFSDVNPPVHAWAVWRVYKMTGPRGGRDRQFLERAFHKLLINFTWWVNRKDIDGKHIFAGGFLGLDNIGVFDRSRPLPTGGHLEQADGTAWMAFYCTTMLAIAIELASEDPTYEDVASKFFEHFVAIADAMNTLGGTGLWDDADGFYYDKLHVNHTSIPMRVRSMVGLIPLIAVEVLEEDVIRKLPGFAKRMRWFLENREDLARHISYVESLEEDRAHCHLLLAIPSRERLTRTLRYMLDEQEFLSPFGLRSLSRHHLDAPYTFEMPGETLRVDYVPGESTTAIFGGNSNWRGPIWFPVNFLIVEALERYAHYYGDTLKIECPTGSGIMLTLDQVADEIRNRLAGIFLPDSKGRRPCHGQDMRYANDPAWRELVLFYEYFHGDTGRGLGASHQTGWTALVERCIDDNAFRKRSESRRELRSSQQPAATHRPA